MDVDMPSSPKQWFFDRAQTVIAPGLKNPDLIAFFKHTFDASDVDGDGIVTATDLEALRAPAWAYFRAWHVARLLEYDLNGDGIISRDDITAVERARLRGHLTADAERRTGKTVATVLAYDRDSDGQIDVQDMLRFADDEAKTQVQQGASTIFEDGEHRQRLDHALLRHVVPLWLDPNDQSAVTRIFYEAAIDRVFDEIDSDRDGIIGVEDAAAFHVALGNRERAEQLLKYQAAAQTSVEALQANLGYVPPKSELEFIALSANHGAGYALVALGGDDEATACRGYSPPK